jgi:DNA gyrase subunit A
VLLSSTGLLARTAPGAAADGVLGEEGPAGRAAHDVIVSGAPATVRGTIGAVTSAGRMIKLSVLEFPALPPSAQFPGLSGGTPVGEFVSLESGETVVALAPLDTPLAGLALGTASGVVKRVLPDYPQARDDFEVVTLKEGDRVVGAASLRDEAQDLVFVSSDGQLLRFPASVVRPQGRLAGGMAGIRLAAGATVIWFGAVDPAGGSSGNSSSGNGSSGNGSSGNGSSGNGSSGNGSSGNGSSGNGSADGAAAPNGSGGAGGGAEAGEPVLVTVAGSAGALPGTAAGSVKVSPYDEFPPKGRATGGVRCHRFLKGEDTLILAWAGPGPALGATEAGGPVELPGAFGRRDGSGVGLAQPLAAVGGAAPLLPDGAAVAESPPA